MKLEMNYTAILDLVKPQLPEGVTATCGNAGITLKDDMTYLNVHQHGSVPLQLDVKKVGGSYNALDFSKKSYEINVRANILIADTIIDHFHRHKESVSSEYKRYAEFVEKTGCVD